MDDFFRTLQAENELHATRVIRIACKVDLWDNGNIAKRPAFYTQSQLHCRLMFELEWSVLTDNNGSFGKLRNYEVNLKHEKLVKDLHEHCQMWKT